MARGPERMPNVPGIVNGIPKFTFSVPVFLPPGMRREELTDEMLEDYAYWIAESCIAPRIGEADNDISITAERVVYGAGDFVVHVTVKKHAERRMHKDYYESVLTAVRDLSYISGIHKFRTAKKFSIQGHAVPVPPPLKEAA